jgi:hypothetical protein
MAEAAAADAVVVLAHMDVEDPLVRCAYTMAYIIRYNMI